jgi:hypothetical protein
VGRSPEERTQAEAWAQHYAAQARQLSGAAAATTAGAYGATGDPSAAGSAGVAEMAGVLL